MFSIPFPVTAAVISFTIAFACPSLSLYTVAANYIKDNKKVDRNNDGKIQYVILEGEMGHQDAIIRTESVVECLKANGIALEKLSYQIANWNRAQAQTRMMQLIGEYKTDIEMVIANSDSMVLGAVDAYEKLGYTESNIPVLYSPISCIILVCAWARFQFAI